MTAMTKAGIISLLFVFTFQTAILYAEQNDASVGLPGERETNPSKPFDVTNPTNPASGPTNLWPEDWLSRGGEKPLSHPGDFSKQGPILIQPEPIRDIKPLPIKVFPVKPIKPIVPPAYKPPPPDLPKVDEMRYYALQAARKKKIKKKPAEVKKVTPKIVRASEESNYPEVTDFNLLALTAENVAFKAILEGLDQNLEVSALLRSSKDSDLAENQIVGMDCKSNSCTGLAQGLSPEISYMISLLVKNPDEDVLHELVSDLEPRTFTTPGLPVEEIFAQVKKIFLRERPENQIPLDETSVQISDFETGCTAVGVCPTRNYNVEAKSKDGKDRIVGTIALFDGSAKKYVSSFRLQRKSSSISSPLAGGKIGL